MGKRVWPSPELGVQHAGDLRCLHRHSIPIAHLRAGFSWQGGADPGAALPSGEGARPRLPQSFLAAWGGRGSRFIKTGWGKTQIPLY